MISAAPDLSRSLENVAINTRMRAHWHAVIAGTLQAQGVTIPHAEQVADRAAGELAALYVRIERRANFRTRMEPADFGAAGDDCPDASWMAGCEALNSSVLAHVQGLSRTAGHALGEAFTQGVSVGLTSRPSHGSFMKWLTKTLKSR
jgi:hypothetical protein